MSIKWGTPSTSRIITGDQHMGAHTAPDWLVEGIIQRSRLYACTSLTAHGKTAVALYLACMIHTGRMVGKLDTFEGNVLYLAGENPDDLAARMLGMARHFKIPSLRMPFVLPSAFPLDQEEADRLTDDIAKLGCDFALIVGDTAASFFAGDDENNNVQAGTYARTWRNLCDCPGNPAVMPLCHPVKNASKDNLLPRGGGAFLNELDANLTLWSPEVGELTTLHWHGKIRGPDFSAVDFRLLRVPTGLQDKKARDEITVIAEPLDEAEATNQKLQSVADEDAVLKALYLHPDWSLRQIAADVGWLDPAGKPERWKVQRSVETLENDGMVKQLRKMGPYSLTQKGKDAVNLRWPGTCS